MIKLIMVDLDGTLIDTKKTNYFAYKSALETYGYTIDYTYYCKFCNGRHYLDFLPNIATNEIEIIKKIHILKQKKYLDYLEYAKINKTLTDLIYLLRNKCKIALVTTASKGNTYSILEWFNIKDAFDLILTQEDVEKPKPDPDGYLKAIAYFNVHSDEAIIFEDSSIGIKAAEQAGVPCFVVKGYN